MEQKRTPRGIEHLRELAREYVDLHMTLRPSQTSFTIPADLPAEVGKLRAQIARRQSRAEQAEAGSKEANAKAATSSTDEIAERPAAGLTSVMRRPVEPGKAHVWVEPPEIAGLGNMTDEQDGNLSRRISDRGLLIARRSMIILQELARNEDSMKKWKLMGQIKDKIDPEFDEFRLGSHLFGMEDRDFIRVVTRTPITVEIASEELRQRVLNNPDEVMTELLEEVY